MIRSFLGYTQEFSYNLKLAFPVIIGLLGHTFVQLIDNIMVGQLGTAPLAAVSLGNSFFFVAMSLGIGFSTAITPLIAEADGAKDLSKGSKIFTHGLILCCGLGLLLSLGVLLSKPLLFDMGQPEAVVVLAYPYLQWVGISLIPLIFFQGFKQFSEGLSHTRPAMYATLLGNIINIILNYFLIFGYWIFPKMGVEGAAIGSLVARCSMLLYLALYIRLSTKFKEYVNKISFRNLQIKLFKGIIKLGFPSAL
ncbi:MAG: MATE family efflux transporter, partial [Flavobacteriaceae bacterium]